jgi:hypothetical protein
VYACTSTPLGSISISWPQRAGCQSGHGEAALVTPTRSLTSPAEVASTTLSPAHRSAVTAPLHLRTTRYCRFEPAPLGASYPSARRRSLPLRRPASMKEASGAISTESTSDGRGIVSTRLLRCGARSSNVLPTPSRETISRAGSKRGRGLDNSPLASKTASAVCLANTCDGCNGTRAAHRTSLRGRGCSSSRDDSRRKTLGPASELSLLSVSSFAPIVSRCEEKLRTKDLCRQST